MTLSKDVIVHLFTRCKEVCSRISRSKPAGEPPSYYVARGVFLTGLGVVYLIAFVSFWTQAAGLIGSKGVLPMDAFFRAVAEQFSPFERLRFAPTLFWISHSDKFLSAVLALGVLASILVILGQFRPFALLLCWLLYLSVVVVGRDFMSFQWDALLLESGLLAIFLGRPSRLVNALFRWLLFRLMFGSGIVKLLSGDPVWRNLTALEYHYFTQPIPTWTAWYLHQLPPLFHRISVGLMFAIELVAPFFIFAPRRFRHGAGYALISLQLLIFLTGNYCFFNLISILLCILLFDDTAWPRRAERENASPKRWPPWLLWPFAAIVLVSTTVQTTLRFGIQAPWPGLFKAVTGFTLPLRSTNSYGLFAVMTTTRPEIIVQGSNDGKTWLDYEFKYKPGDVERRPGFVAPHQPRLDWQMWFAALGDYRQNPWLVNLGVRLLQGSKPVTKLLRYNPFPSKPPKYLRALKYDYQFTSRAEHKATGAWWKREEKGVYLPVMALKNESHPA